MPEFDAEVCNGFRRNGENMIKNGGTTIRLLRNSKSANSFLVALLPVIFVGIACDRLVIPGNVDLFEGDNAKQAVAKIKTKIGAEKVKVIRAEIRQNVMKIQIQAPDNPKNIDEYTFERGSVSGPKPVEILSLGKLEMTGDKYHPTDLDEIDFGAIPGTIIQAIALANTEGAEVELISMDLQKAEMTNPQLKQQRKSEAAELTKKIEQKEKECFSSKSFPEKCLNDLLQLKNRERELSSNTGKVKDWDLAWRIFIRGTRARKDFWADKKGKIIENPFGN